MPGGATPGTPSAKQKDKSMVRTKVVVALYNYKAIESGDLSLEKVRYYKKSFVSNKSFLLALH